MLTQPYILMRQAEAIEAVEAKYREYPHNTFSSFSVAENLQAEARMLREKMKEYSQAISSPAYLTGTGCETPTGSITYTEQTK